MRFNPNLDPAWFGGVMAIINNITMLAIVLTGSALIREREHGTVEHLLVMPVTPFEIMMAKVWSMGLVVLVVSGLSLMLMVKGVLGVPIEGSIPLFMLGVVLSLFATTSIGIFMGTIARSMPQLGLLMILVLLPLQMLSGGSTPRESMPQAVQDIMLTMPTTHFVSLARAILYRGAGLSIVWPQFLTLLAIGGVFFLIALLRFRKRLAQWRKHYCRMAAAPHPAYKRRRANVGRQAKRPRQSAGTLVFFRQTLQVAVAHAALGDNIIGKMLYVAHIALQNGDLQTVIVVDMDVQRGDG